MKILEAFLSFLCPKPDYLTCDNEIIALLASELKKHQLPTDIGIKALSLGYYRIDRKEQVIVFYQVSDLCFAVFMNKTVQVFEVKTIEGIVIDSGIDCSQNKDYQMEDSFYCWGIFIADTHFRIERFKKD